MHYVTDTTVKLKCMGMQMISDKMHFDIIAIWHLAEAGYLLLVTDSFTGY